MIRRVFYAAGPGDIIRSHRHWRQGEDNPTEVSLTYSSQVQDYCRDIAASAYFVSCHPRREILKDGPFTLEHRPKPFPGARGLRYHVGVALYTLGLLATALRFRADVAILDAGSTHYFLMSLFRLFGIRLVPVLHNALWPSGSPPVRPGARLILWLDSYFWRFVPSAIVAVSPECERQVDRLTEGRHPPIHQIRAQFHEGFFRGVPAPPPHDSRPFRVIFVGRVVSDKGVFDLLEIARRVDDIHPGAVRWELCGGGPELDELRRRHRVMGLEGVVSIRGWTSPADQVDVYRRSHVSIVPSRSDCTEALAMTAAEAILAGRPVITSPVVPALELLGPACVVARTDDVDSYVDGVVKLMSDRVYYERLRLACPDLARPFYDRNRGLAAVLRDAIGPVPQADAPAPLAPPAIAPARGDVMPEIDNP